MRNALVFGLILGLVVVGVGGGFTVSLDSDSVPVLHEALLTSSEPLDGDTDNDGLHDGKELELGTDPTKADTDGDGLNDSVEVNRHDTDPTKQDTDGDGLDDRREVNGPTDPTRADTDDDGLTDGEEYDRGTDPLQADTDDDGLADGAEVNQYQSNPTDSDTDDDGLADGAEVNQYGTSPTAPDTDDDGLNDGAEVKRGTEPTVADTDDDGLADGTEVQRGTDPTDADSDGDGLEDGVEIERGTDPLQADTDDDGLSDGDEVRVYNTEPLSPDTDSDGLDDRREVNGPTDPLEADTDSDGLDDGREYEIGTDPTDPDTDGDHLPDGLEASSTHEFFEHADPLKKDVFVEVDYADGTQSSLSSEEFQRIERAFAEAPVENPDGTTGVNLHFYYDKDSVSVPITVSGDEYRQEYHQQFFNANGYGFHHVLIVENVEQHSVTGDSETVGLHMGGDGMLVEASSDQGATGSRVMHELGHSLGLDPEDHAGIDSRDVEWSSYPSVMNYNMPTDCGFFSCSRDYSAVYTFSDGDEGPLDHDDWAVIAEEMGDPSTSAIDEAES